jgi:hypothetical protein
VNGFFIGFAVALLLWFAAFLYFKAFVRRRTSPDHILGLLQEDVRELEADIDEKTEQSLQLLEEKIRVLRDICGEAERRIAVFNREFEKREQETQTYAALGKKPLVERLVVQGEKSPREPPSEPARKRDTKPARPVKAAQPAQVAPQPDPGTPEPKALNITRSGEPLAIKPRPIGERITELQQAGFSPELIARRLDINIGEVELYFRLESTSNQQ